MGHVLATGARLSPFRALPTRRDALFSRSRIGAGKLRGTCRIGAGMSRSSVRSPGFAFADPDMCGRSGTTAGQRPLPLSSLLHRRNSAWTHREAFAAWRGGGPGSIILALNEHDRTYRCKRMALLSTHFDGIMSNFLLPPACGPQRHGWQLSAPPYYRFGGSPLMVGIDARFDRSGLPCLPFATATRATAFPTTLGALRPMSRK